MNAETIRILIAKGLTAQDILDVAETLEAPKARSSAAIRQANYRERKKAEAEACDVTSDVTRDASQRNETPPLSPPNDIYSNPPLSPPLQKSGARKGSRLPDDWQPKPLPSDLAVAVAKWPDGEVSKQLAMFRDWAASAPGSKGIKSDWDAAWRNWLRRVDGERPRSTSPPRQAPSNSNTLRLTREKLHGTGY